MIIKEDKPNLGRQIEFDIVKVLAIFFMISIHVYEEWSLCDYENLCSTPFNIIIEFLGGPLAAPVFMFSLGLGLAYSKHREPKQFIIRGIRLLVFSYVFNIFRNTIPMLIAFGTDVSYELAIYLVFEVDILTFAGLTFIFTGIMKKLKVPVLAMLAISVAFQAIGATLSDTLTIESDAVNYICAPFFATPLGSYFPFLQWYIYPCLGLTFAKYLRHIEDTDKLYGSLLIFAIVFMAALCVGLYFNGFDLRYFFAIAEDVYYDQNILYVLFTVSAIMIEVSIVHFVVKFIHIKPLEKVIMFMSSSLNTIYIIQWLIIGWVEFIVFGYEGSLPVEYSFLIGFGIMIVATLIAYLVKLVKKKIKEKKQNNIKSNENAVA